MNEWTSTLLLISNFLSSLIYYSCLLTYLPSPLDSELLESRDNTFPSLCSQESLLGPSHSGSTVFVEMLHLVWAWTTCRTMVLGAGGKDIQY